MLRLSFPLLQTPKLDRLAWGGILASAAVVALTMAYALERFGLSVGHIRPLAFVGTLVVAKLSLFALWPRLGRLRWNPTPVVGEVFHAASPESEGGQLTAKARAIVLWDDASRLSAAVFAANVPTFVLSSDQRQVDWNEAFDLIFAGDGRLHRGGSVAAWYALLDNFRRLPKRTTMLQGEEVLPLADRDRVVYFSTDFGRMVFTKVMAPLVDLASGRIVGWSVVLNINSVHHRAEFFLALNRVIAKETQRQRYAAAYDQVLGGFSGRRELVEKCVTALAPCKRIIDLGCGTGSLTAALAAEGHRVTAVEGDHYLLRQTRLRCRSLTNVKLVRKALGDLTSLPDQRYDGAALGAQLQEQPFPGALLRAVHAGLKPGGLLLLTLRADGSSLDTLVQAAAGQLEKKQAFDVIKHQLPVVRSGLLADQAQRSLRPQLTLEAARSLLAQAGFVVDAEEFGLEDGRTHLLFARKA